MAVLTENGLYTNGFGGPRLGLGHDKTVFVPNHVSGIVGKVATVALGPDHSVALTETGEVFCWGSNKYGQLGFATDLVGDEYSPCFVPREVAGPLKKVKVILAAASKHHTVIATELGLIYTWGLNIGMLGYHQNAGASDIQIVPRKVTGLTQGNILSLAATNTATALLQETDVIVLAQNECRRVIFQIPTPVRAINMHTPNPLAIRITKVVSGNHQFAALTSTGDVFLWSPPGIKEFKDTWQQILFPQTKPKRIWHTRKEDFTAQDVAIGIDSTILIRTQNGVVFKGVR
jgi:alpha-tubulin suppressor-like RCC1 family protein